VKYSIYEICFKKEKCANMKKEDSPIKTMKVFQLIKDKFLKLEKGKYFQSKMVNDRRTRQ
jgi:hypothetical protein